MHQSHGSGMSTFIHLRFNKIMILLVSCLLFLFDKVTGGELCPGTDNVYCDGYDEYCCGTSCCLYDWHYDYGFWNIWYFWFIIFFILMSCCGGCGFYRRRQVYLRQHQAASLAHGPPQSTILNPGHTTYSSTMGHTIVAHPMMFPQAPQPQGYFPGPPSYTEVTSKPDLYPKAYANTNSNGGATPYPISDPAYPPPAPGQPYSTNSPTSPQGTAPPYNGVSPPTDTAAAPSDTAPPHNGIAPPPYTPRPPSEVPPSSTISNTHPPHST